MKKVFCLLLISIIIGISMEAKNRKIVIDETKDDIRVVEAQGTCIGGLTSTKILWIGLQTWVSPQDTTYILVTNVNSSLHSLGAFDDAIMLIRLMDDEVIELKSVASNNNITDVEIGNPTITTNIYKNRITSTYNSNTVSVGCNVNYWPLTIETVESLKKGIKKIKIQFRNGEYEKEFKKDKMGKILYDSYLSELDYIDDNSKKENFLKDF